MATDMRPWEYIYIFSLNVTTEKIAKHTGLPENLIDDACEMNYLEKKHIEAAKMNTAITESFFTPDRVKVQVYANMVDRAGQTYPEFRLVKIKEDNEM